MIVKHDRLIGIKGTQTNNTSIKQEIYLSFKFLIHSIILSWFFTFLIDLFILRYYIRLLNFSIVNTFIFFKLLRSIHSKRHGKTSDHTLPTPFLQDFSQKSFSHVLDHYPNSRESLWGIGLSGWGGIRSLKWPFCTFLH